MCIERPVSGKAKEWADDAINASQMQPPSVAMASDVREIAARQQQKMMETTETKKVKLKKRLFNFQNFIYSSITTNNTLVTNKT